MTHVTVLPMDDEGRLGQEEEFGAVQVGLRADLLLDEDLTLDVR